MDALSFVYKNLKKNLFSHIIMNVAIKYSDKVGVASNLLCMLHCFATPFIFLSQTQTAHIGHDVPFAWQIINYFLSLFLELQCIIQ